MKVKFDLVENDRLKAYYLLQLRDKLNRPGTFSKDYTFDKFLNDFALEQFRIGLDAEVAKLEERLFRVEV